MTEEKISKPTELFGANLALLLADKISTVHKSFNQQDFIRNVGKNTPKKSLTQRVELISDQLKEYLPDHFPKAVSILVKIMGEENPDETGMFKKYYWLMPVGKFIEKYGLDHPEVALQSIEELTKRNTGEYAIRPYIRKYPSLTLPIMKNWARSDNFHLRRLASEGLRPKLPWAPKLVHYIDNPKPVFSILNLLKGEQVRFVQKSVANNLTDYIKVNPEAAFAFIDTWRSSKNEHTQWMIKYATRKYQ